MLLARTNVALGLFCRRLLSKRVEEGEDSHPTTGRVYDKLRERLAPSDNDDKERYLMEGGPVV